MAALIGHKSNHKISGIVFEAAHESGTKVSTRMIFRYCFVQFQIWVFMVIVYPVTSVETPCPLRFVRRFMIIRDCGLRQIFLPQCIYESRLINVQIQ